MWYRLLSGIKNDFILKFFFFLVTKKDKFNDPYLFYIVKKSKKIKKNYQRSSLYIYKFYEKL